MGRRLIFIDDKPGYGGVSTCLICLANELCKRGYEITLIAAKKNVYETRVDALVQIEECDFTDEKAVERMIKSLNDRCAEIVNSHADSGIQLRLLRQKTEHISYILPNIWRFLMIRNISSREKNIFHWRIRRTR